MNMKNRQENATSRRQLMSANISMLPIFWSMLPQLHLSESTLDPDKNTTQQGLSGPNELNLTRGESVMIPVPVFSSPVNDQPSFTPIHRGTETEISTDIASASDVDTLLPMVLLSWHARRTLCALSPRDSTC
jgi:hypothetical protein